MPVTVIQTFSEPRRPILMVSPSTLSEDGSPTTQASTRSPSAISCSTTSLVPWVARPSSSPVISRDREPFGSPSASTWETAAIQQAMPPFMSTAPRPMTTPSTSSAAKGSDDQASVGPVGTTSVWPAKQRFGPSVPRRA